MKSQKHIFTLLALWFVFSQNIYSQDNIKGLVLDSESKLPIADASIYWAGSSFGTKSNSEGKFQIKKLSSNNQLVISYLGFEKIVLGPGEWNKTEQLSISLKQTIYQADEVIVNANRANEKSGMAFSNISKKDLEKQNLGQDMPILLNISPSLVTTSDAGAGIGYTGLRIRGTDATRINIMVNGIPINDSESQGVYWVNMPDLASSVSSIQIQRGVGTSTNGAGAFGGSINIQSNEFHQKAYAEYGGSAGSFNSFKNTLKLGSGLMGKFTVDARLSKITSDGFVDRAFSNLKSYYISGAYYGKKSFVRLVHFGGNEKTYQSWNGIPEDKLNTDRTYNAFTYENQTDNYSQSHWQLLTTHTLHKNWSLNANLHYTNGKGYYEEFKDGQALSDYSFTKASSIATTDLIRQKWLDNDFYGATYSLDYQSNKKLSSSIGGAFNIYDGIHFGEFVSAKGYETTAVKGFRWYESNSRKTDFNIYSKTNYQATDKLNFYLDLQVRALSLDMKGTASKLQNIDQKHSYSFFNPKLGLNYQLSDQFSTYLSYAVGQKEPNRTDFIDNKGSSVPKHEKLKDFELGFKHFTKNISFAANGYYMNYKNQLVVTGAINDVGEPIRTNIPESSRLGIELEAGILISKKVNWKVNATLSKNTVKNFTEVIPDYAGATLNVYYKKADIALSPSQILGSELSFIPTKSFEIALLTKYVGKQYLDNTSNENRKLNPYFTNDLRLKYQLKPKHLPELNLGFLFNNLLNEKYESNGYTFSYIYENNVYTENYFYPQAGRNFMVSLNIALNKN
jgi:iron complex outermembrane recepter protein